MTGGRRGMGTVTPPGAIDDAAQPLQSHRNALAVATPLPNRQ
jgi:hypothetical protein